MIRRSLAFAAAMLVCVFAASSVHARSHRHQAVVDANGNAPGVVVSHKTGARARVAPEYASRFQSYVDAIEATGAEVRFMGGIRPGHCSSSSMHPCGRALDVCQTGRGRVDHRCHLPAPAQLRSIAASVGLFEGSAWCHSDYGHAQTQETAAACGSRPATMTASAKSRRAAPVMAAAPAFDRLTSIH
jgi:hypothetical protein